MKLMIRFMGISFIGLIYLTMFMEMMYKDVLFNELNQVTSLAMNETQIVMMEQLEDRYYCTNNARRLFMSNNEYINDFINNFKELISSDAKYELEVYEADIEGGILDVNVTLRYKTINGKEESITLRKTNIVDVLWKEGF